MVFTQFGIFPDIVVKTKHLVAQNIESKEKMRRKRFAPLKI
jgi:hypothetical protein